MFRWILPTVLACLLALTFLLAHSRCWLPRAIDAPYAYDLWNITASIAIEEEQNRIAFEFVNKAFGVEEERHLSFEEYVIKDVHVYALTRNIPIAKPSSYNQLSSLCPTVDEYEVDEEAILGCYYQIKANNQVAILWASSARIIQNGIHYTIQEKLLPLSATELEIDVGTDHILCPVSGYYLISSESVLFSHMGPTPLEEKFTIPDDFRFGYVLTTESQ